MQQNVDPSPPIVPQGQYSREAKHMRVMLMLCVKEKVFDQPILEQIFSQWMQCEAGYEGQGEEIENQFRKALGRIYGPRSKNYLDAIDRARVKLEQLKERKSKGELGSGPIPNSSMPIGMTPQQNQPQPISAPIPPPQQAPYTFKPIPGMNPGQNPNMHPGMSANMNPGMNPSMNQVMNQNINQSHNQPHNQGMPQNPGMQQFQMMGMQQANFQNYNKVPGMMNSMQNLPQQQMNLQQQQQQQHQQQQQQQPPPQYQHQPMIGQGGLHDNRHMNPQNMNISGLPHVNIDGNRNLNPPSIALPPHDIHNVPPPPQIDDLRDDSKKSKTAKKKGPEDTKKPEMKKQKSKSDDKEIKPVYPPVMNLPIEPPRPPLSIPMNPADEFDNLEKPTITQLTQDGLQPTDKGIMTGQILESKLLSKEELTTRQLLRETVDSDRALNQSMERVEYEAWMDKNVVGKDILEKAINNTCRGKVELSSEAKKLVSDGIQSHLKTILESALDSSRRRLNRSAFGNYYESLQHLKMNNGRVTDHHLHTVALKWGPDVVQVIKEEESKMRQNYKDYCELDEEKLKEKMKLYDEERTKAIGKRKAGGGQPDNEAHWWEIDQAFEEEGILSYDKIAEVWKKNDIAVKFELGSHMKRKQKKAEVAGGDSISENTLKLGMKVGNESSIPMDMDDQRSIEQAWQNQSPPFPYPQEASVNAEDVFSVLSKVSARKGSLMGRSTESDQLRKTRFQWKLFAK